MSKQSWTAEQLGDQSGRIAIVTGANSGIGFETARVLAEKGATVVMACRNLDKANPKAEEIRTANPGAMVEVMQLDLSDLESVKRFAQEFRGKYQRLDLLINNAGIMVPPYGQTAQGFETQFGVNHLGHFALTGALLGLITNTPGSRIVTVSSVAHLFGKIDFSDLNWENGYKAQAAYGQSKLANLLFTYELQRRLAAAGKDTLAVAAHPGWTETNLQVHAKGVKFLNRFLAQAPPMGALPTLYAATAPDVNGAEYFGPSGFLEMNGPPKKVKSNRRSHDQNVA
ncbi:MAG: SDR family NAD(P)-dependent oxidoreductase, partial [Myxococcales bacterium]|nr:SDR family NAD(P)-dependent oxidoreductase [Myxococcales bacterium]